MPSRPALYVGLMSGTSLDGIDTVLVDFADEGSSRLQVLHHGFEPFPADLRDELLALNTAGGHDELQRAALAANGVARAYAGAVQRLLRDTRLSADSIVALGAHGQTVRHRPGEFDGVGFTLQLGNPALLAELCHIDVIADFRSRDVAAGGQGAPLVPAFHRAVFGRASHDIAVLNLGGIANLTLLHADGATGGFDCGPANALMDAWATQHLGQPFDAHGAWAASGQVLQPLLAAMLSEPFFGLMPPKSTGRDLFNPDWLQRHLSASSGRTHWAPVDVQATLLELTARAAADALHRHLPTASELLVCGGGALNQALMRRLDALCPRATLKVTDDLGLPATQVEAAAFAWLAKAFVEHRPGNLQAVTGARGPRVLGALYPK